MNEKKATARETILDQIAAYDYYIDDYDEAITRAGKDLAREITRLAEGKDAARAAAYIEDRVRMTLNAIEEYHARRDTAKAQKATAQALLEVMDAASGEYSYICAQGYYGLRARKFTSEEERDAYLDGLDEYQKEHTHAATEEELEQILAGRAMVELG